MISLQSTRANVGPPDFTAFYCKHFAVGDDNCTPSSGHMHLKEVYTCAAITIHSRSNNTTLYTALSALNSGTAAQNLSFRPTLMRFGYRIASNLQQYHCTVHSNNPQIAPTALH